MPFLRISEERASAPNTTEVAENMEKIKEIIEAPGLEPSQVYQRG
jgi:hypothetical protein